MKQAGYSMERRLAFELAWPLVLGLIVLCLAILGATAKSFAHKQNAQMATKMAATIEAATTGDREGGLDGMRMQLRDSVARRSGTYLELRSPDGETLYRDVVGARDPAKTRTEDFTLSTSRGEVRGRLVLDTADDYRMLGRLSLILLGALLLGGMAIWTGSGWRVRHTMQPLIELAEQMRAITPDRIERRLSLARPVSELQPWIDQFNEMLDRLESAYRQLEAFNADVAHELRTPLAALMGHAEVALSREDRTTSSLRDTLVGNLEELQRMSGMVNDMLFLSRADRGATARYGEPGSLATLVRQVVDFHEAPLVESQLRVYIKGDAELAVDAPLFKRAVSNLLGNATRYAARGSAIEVQIDTDSQGRAQVTVENEGPDIDPAQLPRLFDRFYRCDESRVDGHLHHGLGLAIVAAIARMHEGWTLAVSGGGRTRIGLTMARSGR